MTSHVVIKSSRFGMTVNLDPNCAFEDILLELERKFKENAGFWGNVQMVLMLEGREVTAKEELEIINAITGNTGIEILCLLDQDASRIERCEKALSQKLMEVSTRTGQFYRGDLADGETLESENSIVMIGNVRPGARVTAKGNIIVLGELKGSACAGASGNADAIIAALEMAPKQLRIASCSTKYKEKPKRLGWGPMAAFLEGSTICVKSIKKGFPQIG